MNDQKLTRLPLNKRGRPIMKNAIHFGPQPKSIVQQMLSEMKMNTVSDGKDENVKSLNDPGDQEGQEDASLSPDYDNNEQKANANEDIICSVCPHRSSTAEEHKQHLRGHRLYSCDFPNCKYTCRLLCNLTKHKRVHTNEKPYLCESCCFRSNFVNSLKAHLRTHTAERPHVCSHCSYKCNSSSNLKKHCRLKHPTPPTVTELTPG